MSLLKIAVEKLPPSQSSLENLTLTGGFRMVSGRNAIHIITSQRLITVPGHFAVFVWRGFGENEVE